MSGITTHILDTSRGCPAAEVPVSLERAAESGWRLLNRAKTDEDGRARDLLASAPEAGRYRLTFDTGAYFTAVGDAGFYPEVTIVFEVEQGQDHYHVPLLLSPFGYSTYRGS